MDVIKSIEKSKRKHFVLKNGKICCTLTGHEMPLSSDALLAYSGGKKFARALAKWATDATVPDEYRCYLIDAKLVEKSPDKRNPDGEAVASSKMLFCQLTCRFVSDTPGDVARHTSGRRFLTALLDYKTARKAGRLFEPNTSLYRKYRSRMTLEGLAGAGAAVKGRDDVGNDEDEIDSHEEDPSEGDDAEEVEDDDEEMKEIQDEVMEDKQQQQQRQQPSSPLKQKQNEKKVKRKGNANLVANESNGDQTQSQPKKRRK